MKRLDIITLNERNERKCVLEKVIWNPVNRTDLSGH